MSLFAELAGVMSRADIAKSAEKRRWKDVSLNRKSIARLSNTSSSRHMRVQRQSRTINRVRRWIAAGM